MAAEIEFPGNIEFFERTLKFGQAASSAESTKNRILAS
jgi:hypothetical protein